MSKLLVTYDMSQALGSDEAAAMAAVAAGLCITIDELDSLRAYAAELQGRAAAGTLDEDALRAARDLGQRVGALAAGLSPDNHRRANFAADGRAPQGAAVWRLAHLLNRQDVGIMQRRP